MKKWKRLLIILVVPAALLLGYLGYRIFFAPGLKAGEYETAIVDSGRVVVTVPATGTVSPENEVFILSPATTIIKHIHIEPGSHVRKGEVIMVMDPESIENEIDKLQDQLEVKKNTLEKTRLNARNTKVDLDYDVEVKKLRIASLKSDIADQEQLLDVGGISPARFEKTKQELVLAQKDLDRIQEKNSIRLKQLAADEEGLKIQIGIQEKELQAKRELLGKMIVRAPSDGIVLAVSARAGERVNKDRLLVTLSDLTTFKIVCHIDEEQSDILETGGKIYAVAGDEWLPGQIGRISPVIEDDKVEFNAYLEQSNHEFLRPNLHLNLLVVRDERESVLRVRNSSVFDRGNSHEVFVIHSGKAVRQTVQTGMKGNRYVEIVNGLLPGDEIITSDIAMLRRTNEIELRNKVN